MKIIPSTGSLLEQQADTYLIFMMDDGFEAVRDNATHQLDTAIGGQLKAIVEAGDFGGKQESTLVLYPQNNDILAKRVIVVGLGVVDKFTADIAKRCVAIGIKKARDLKAQVIAAVTLGTGRGNLTVIDSVRCIAEGALLGLYQYHGQKSDDAPENTAILNSKIE